MWASTRPRRRDDARASRGEAPHAPEATTTTTIEETTSTIAGRASGPETARARAGAPRATRFPLVVTTTSSVRGHRTPPFVWQHLEQLGEPPRERAARLGRAEEEHVPLLALEQVRRRAWGGGAKHKGVRVKIVRLDAPEPLPGHDASFWNLVASGTDGAWTTSPFNGFGQSCVDPHFETIVGVDPRVRYWRPIPTFVSVLLELFDPYIKFQVPK